MRVVNLDMAVVDFADRASAVHELARFGRAAAINVANWTR
jgi:hypothetical protein